MEDIALETSDAYSIMVRLKECKIWFLELCEFL
jgi:hypothetical protein